MASELYNLGRMTTATTGTGTITLGSAVSGYLTFALAGVSNGETVSYGIYDGANSEVGTGVYTSAGTTLSRTVTKSTNSDAAISLSGTAQVFITPRAEDFPVYGTYTPTLTNTTNLAASTAAVCQYMQVGSGAGSVVTVSGTFNADPTTGGGATTEMGMSLPVASDFASVSQCGGSGSYTASSPETVMIVADVTNNRAKVTWGAVDVANHTVSFIFQYLVV